MPSIPAAPFLRFTCANATTVSQVVKHFSVSPLTRREIEAYADDHGRYVLLLRDAIEPMTLAAAAAPLFAGSVEIF
jgi:hypothetical protein